MTDFNNKEPKELSEDEYWADYRGSCVPHEQQEDPQKPEMAVGPGPSSAPEIISNRDTNELIAELNQIVELSEQLRPSHPELPPILSLLNYYKNRIASREWKEPMAPFPPYEQMTTMGKALWLLMHEVCCRGDTYGTNVGEFNGVIDPFLDEFFPGVQRDATKLSEEERKQLNAQLGIGDFLLYHYMQFRRTYNDVHRFSKE